MFHEVILATTFLSLSQKKNILRLIMKKYPNEFILNKDEDRKKLFQILDNIIKKRDALAHGEIIIDLSNDTTIIQYYDSSSNRKNKFEITPDFFNKLSADVSGIAFALGLTKEKRDIPQL